jgi:hypothetical protein
MSTNNKPRTEVSVNNSAASPDGVDLQQHQQAHVGKHSNGPTGNRGTHPMQAAVHAAHMNDKKCPS